MVLVIRHAALRTLALALSPSLSLAVRDQPGSHASNPVAPNQTSFGGGQAIKYKGPLPFLGRGPPTQHPPFRTYQEAGAFNLELQESNVQHATSNLQQKSLLASNQQVSSRFADVRQLGWNGWTCKFSITVQSLSSTGAIPIRSAIQGLRLSEAFAPRRGGVIIPRSKGTVVFGAPTAQNYAIERTHDCKVKVDWQKYYVSPRPS